MTHMFSSSFSTSWPPSSTSTCECVVPAFEWLNMNARPQTALLTGTHARTQTHTHTHTGTPTHPHRHTHTHTHPYPPNNTHTHTCTHTHSHTHTPACPVTFPPTKQYALSLTLPVCTHLQFVPIIQGTGGPVHPKALVWLWGIYTASCARFPNQELSHTAQRGRAVRGGVCVSVCVCV